MELISIIVFPICNFARHIISNPLLIAVWLMMHQATSFSHGRCLDVRRLQIAHALSLIWQFTESNFSTFVLPNTAFGLLAALSNICVSPDSEQQDQERWSRLGPGLLILMRLPLSVLFNWCLTLIFDLSNQRGKESIQEDKLNKPWRPIPTGQATADQARRALLVLVPVALALSFLLEVWTQGTMILILCWLYNDLKGGDGLARDPIISVAFGLFNSASLQITTGKQVNKLGVIWTGIVSGVILTTMQVQDLKDQPGDKIRGRRSMPLFVGDTVSRISIAMLMGFWTWACGHFWDLDLFSYLVPAMPAFATIIRVLSKRTAEEDACTWRWWCLWTVALYSLPLLAQHEGLLGSLPTRSPLDRYD